MTKDDIIRMAREAELPPCHTTHPKALARFAAIVAAAEREVCADIAENWNCNGMPRYGVAEEIRKRGAP